MSRIILQELKDEVSEARDEAQCKAKRDYPCAFSRGTYLCTADKDGQCGPNVEAECPDWRGTRKEIEDLIKLVILEYPNVTEIYISGGYDGADSPHAYHQESDYDPWVSEWSVTIWERQ